MDPWVWELIRNISVGLVVAAIGWIAGALNTRRRVKRNADEWTLEHVSGTDWTLRRDSKNVALETRLYVNPSGPISDRWERSKDARFKPGRVRYDFAPGDVVDVENVPFGASIVIEWIEQDIRREIAVLTRESTPRMDLTRKNVQRSTW